jgi:hypothetical protein
MLMVFNCLLGACTADNNNQERQVSEGYPLLDLPDWYGYSWVRDTEFNSLDAQEQLSRVTIATLGDDSRTHINAIKAAPSGDVYVVGLVGHANLDNENDLASTSALFARYDRNLNPIKSIEVPDLSSCIALEVDREGNVYVSCGTEEGDLIVKYSSDLEEIYRQETEFGAHFTSMELSDDGNLYMSGLLGTSDSDTYASDAIIARYSTEFDFLAYQTWNGGKNSNYFTGLGVAADGSVYVVGEMRDMYPPVYPILRKYNADLSSCSEVVIEPEGYYDRFVDLAIASDGSVYAVFNSGNRDGDDPVCEIIRYTNSLEEVGSIFLADEVFNAANLPMEYTSFLNLNVIEVDRDGLIYCVGTMSALTTFGDSVAYTVVIVQSSELSILNVVLLPIFPISRGFERPIACLSDDADLYLSGCYVDTSAEPTFAQIVK